MTESLKPSQDDLIARTVDALADVDVENARLKDRIQKLEAEVERLKGIARRYGKHETVCGLNVRMGALCKCGWSRVRESLESQHGTLDTKDAEIERRSQWAWREMRRAEAAEAKLALAESNLQRIEHVAATGNETVMVSWLLPFTRAVLTNLKGAPNNG